jgi:hypothetical protein
MHCQDLIRGPGVEQLKSQGRGRIVTLSELSAECFYSPSRKLLSDGCKQVEPPPANRKGAVSIPRIRTWVVL